MRLSMSSAIAWEDKYLQQKRTARSLIFPCQAIPPSPDPYDRAIQLKEM